MRDETTLGGANERFGQTRWTTIRRAQDGSSEHLARILRDYWKPIYFYIRRAGEPVENAKDLTQGFMLAFVEKDFLKGVAPARGRFRSFIVAALKHYLADQRDRERAAKRGGQFNFVTAEIELPSSEPTPERAFFRGWANSVVERARERLRGRVSAEDFDLLDGKGGDSLTPDDRKNRLRRLRAELRECLRQVIQPLVEHEHEVDEEIDELLASCG
ncbi:MAG TPA: hypothetical protein VE981_19045 [Planctomycetota bacterium]|nr:hypothetical protein [Planctomycetota bacterium]